MLHTNVPGHPDFNVYAKCNFLLVFPDAAASPLLEPLGEPWLRLLFTAMTGILNIVHVNSLEVPDASIVNDR